MWSGIVYFESMNLLGTKMVIFVLLSAPLSARGCLDKKSAAEWFFPGVTWMLNQ